MIYNPADVASCTQRSVGGTLAADPIQSVPTEARTALSGMKDYFTSGDAGCVLVSPDWRALAQLC
jgi:hypothetical protein